MKTYKARRIVKRSVAVGQTNRFAVIERDSLVYEALKGNAAALRE
jgi:hypothetical protein